jgi:quercetin dioxygenase-like cupin family protein
MNQLYSFIQLLESAAAAPPDGIVSRTVYSDEHLNVILFTFAPGQELSEHTASAPAAIHILKGQARLTLGEDVKEGKDGSWAYMTAKLPHSILAQTEVTMLLMMFKDRTQ